jgi:putative ABC transport system permease protein
MIAVALRTLRHRPGGFAATFLSAFLGATLLMTFAAMTDTAAGADPASAESLTTTTAVAGGWCLVIVVFAVTSTLSLAVRRRGEQMALLRRIGATGPQLRRMIVGEAAAVALVATVAAVPAGLLLGRLLLALMVDTGQVAAATGYVFGPVALVAGFGVTLLGAVVAAFATARRTTRPPGARPARPRLRRLAAALFLLAGTACAVLTATVMNGQGIDAMQTAGQASGPRSASPCSPRNCSAWSPRCSPDRCGWPAARPASWPRAAPGTWPGRSCRWPCSPASPPAPSTCRASRTTRRPAPRSRSTRRTSRR